VAAGVVVCIVGVAAAASVADTDIRVLVASAVLGVLPAALTCVAVLRREPPSITPADRVTLLRSVLASGCAAVAAMAVLGPAPERSWWLFALVVVTMSLDAVDGWVARRTGTATEAGALLDMQLDAGVFVVLSIAAIPIVGAWVVLIGAMRYLYVAASWLWPVLATPLPRSQFRRGVAGIQSGALAAALAPALPEEAATAVLAISLALLLASFGSQVLAVRQVTTH
jgi:phosphatidylglycerophosphate synthase